MAVEAMTRTTITQEPDASVLARILEEGYGPGAWHGADLRAALADLTPRAALGRPAAGRHNAAEIAVHHAWTLRNAAARLAGTKPGPFPLEGDDWFEVDEQRGPSWPEVVKLLEDRQHHFERIVAGIGAGTIASPLTPAERFELVLGVTCHAVYHAGQIQLIKVLTAGD